MASMVPRRGAWGFQKWLNGQSIVGSASEPWKPACVAMKRAAGYVNASRDARGRDQFRDDEDSPEKPTLACSARLWRGGRHRTGLRGAFRLHRRAVPEGLYPAPRRAGADPDR